MALASIFSLSAKTPEATRKTGHASRAVAVEQDGILALLVTDLVGFTAMVERFGDTRAQRVIQEHNRVMRECIERRRGWDVVHTGDGFVAAFRSVACALRCAADMQRALGRHNEVHPTMQLHARMGVHAGEPLPEEGRLFGHCVNLAVRVCSKAPARSVLVTDVVRQLAQGRFEFLGGLPHALKGVAEAVTLYEYAWADQLEPSP